MLVEPAARQGVLTFSAIAEARPGRGEDRVAIRKSHGGALVVVADGAGGTSGGAEAADAVCSAAATLEASSAGSLERWLAALDRQLDAAPAQGGLAAAAVILISDRGEIVGASVGDCEAWVFGPSVPVNLTAGQIRKPLLGSGRAVPVGFQGELFSTGTLIVATDGLWKYAQPKIVEEISRRQLDVASSHLIDAVRLRSGALQDDVAIVVCAVR